MGIGYELAKNNIREVIAGELKYINCAPQQAKRDF